MSIREDDYTSLPPVPPVSPPLSLQEERRIWIGNLDARLTEFQLLKIAQKCGPIEKFDMLFHKGGPLIGQSRGYAFVTYKTIEATVNALDKLNGQYVGKRSLAVRLAKNLNYDEMEKPRHRIEIPALGTRPRESKISKEEAIRAIEEKLKALEKKADDDLKINASTATEVPLIKRYQFNKDRDTSTSVNGLRTVTSRYSYGKNYSGPYNRNQRPKKR